MYQIEEFHDGGYTFVLRKARASAGDIATNLQHALSLPDIGTQIFGVNISQNGLTHLPDVIWTLLPNLRGLWIDNNNLQHLPQEIGGLTRLEALDAMSNNLSDLPSSLKNLTKLENLFLGGNKRLPANLQVDLMSREECQAFLTKLPNNVPSMSDVPSGSLPPPPVPKAKVAPPPSRAAKAPAPAPEPLSPFAAALLAKANKVNAAQQAKAVEESTALIAQAEQEAPVKFGRVVASEPAAPPVVPIASKKIAPVGAANKAPLAPTRTANPPASEPVSPFAAALLAKANQVNTSQQAKMKEEDAHSHQHDAGGPVKFGRVLDGPPPERPVAVDDSRQTNQWGRSSLVKKTTSPLPPKPAKLPDSIPGYYLEMEEGVPCLSFRALHRKEEQLTAFAHAAWDSEIDPDSVVRIRFAKLATPCPAWIFEYFSNVQHVFLTCKEADAFEIPEAMLALPLRSLSLTSPSLTLEKIPLSITQLKYLQSLQLHREDGYGSNAIPGGFQLPCESRGRVEMWFKQFASYRNGTWKRWCDLEPACLCVCGEDFFDQRDKNQHWEGHCKSNPNARYKEGVAYYFDDDDSSAPAKGPCRHCGGSKQATCSSCSGKGQWFGGTSGQKSCPRCKGAGIVACKRC